MKKICISTYCEWTSYGSVLQSIGFAKMMKGKKPRVCFKFKVKYIIKKMIGWE